MQLPSVVEQFLPLLKRNLCALVVFALCIPAYIVPTYLQTSVHNPPVGVYIGVMGLLAAIVTFFRLRKTEKAAWIVLFTLLMVAEIRNLYVADADQIRKFSTISGDLDATKNGLNAAADGIRAAADAIKQNTDKNDKHFSSTMAESHEAISQMTGGDSLSVVTITADGSGFVIVPEGDYPLYDLGVDMTGFDDKIENHLSHFEMSPHVERPWFRAQLDQFTKLNYSIQFTARNGGWWETLQLRKVNGRWATAIKVEQPVLMVHNKVKLNQPLRTKVRFVWVSPTYPEIDGKVEWCGFVTTKPPRDEPNPCIPNTQKK
jgi:hypothetical protein